MAGSYRHITNADGSCRGMDLLKNTGDAAETIEEMYLMIAYMASQLTPNDPRQAIHEAWLEGYLRPLSNDNADNLSLTGFDAFWDQES